MDLTKKTLESGERYKNGEEYNMRGLLVHMLSYWSTAPSRFHIWSSNTSTPVPEQDIKHRFNNE